MKWKTVAGVLEYQADHYPDSLFARFLARGEVAASYTYSEAWEWVQRWATLLVERGLRRGEVAVLALPNSDDFLGAYYGTLLAGGVPAPVAPFRRIEADDPYLATVARRLKFTHARALVVSPGQTGVAHLPALASMDGLAVVSRRDLPPEPQPLARRHARPGHLRVARRLEDGRAGEAGLRPAPQKGPLQPVPATMRGLGASTTDRPGRGGMNAASPHPPPAAMNGAFGPAGAGGEDDLGLLQFTSGTSGSAKAVMLSNGALLAQTRAISTALKLDRLHDSAVSWLPLYHDMGIIGFLLTPSILGGTVTFLATEDFIRRPGLWIKALSEYGATITGGPPSAYMLCARRMKEAEVEQHDLRRVRVALVGAEMITPESLRQFVEKFEPAGFRATSLVPTYGLAENGLAVTMAPLDRSPKWDTLEARRLRAAGLSEALAEDGHTPRQVVSVGVPVSQMQVAIANPAGDHLPEREVGEIIVRSPSLMKGYLNQPEATRESLRDGWLWTGDLGYLAEGQLYMIGRQKEILIVGGRNYLPEELEEAAAVPGVRADRVVAISYEDAERATEAAVVLAETNLTGKAERDALRMRIRNAVIGAGLPLSRVVLLPLKTIRSTNNGKLMRTECKTRFLAGEFDDDD